MLNKNKTTSCELGFWTGGEANQTVNRKIDFGFLFSLMICIIFNGFQILLLRQKAFLDFIYNLRIFQEGCEKTAAVISSFFSFFLFFFLFFFSLFFSSSFMFFLQYEDPQYSDLHQNSHDPSLRILRVEMVKLLLI